MNVSPALLVVILLGGSLLGGLTGIIVLAAQGATIPDVLELVTVGSLTSLGAILAPSTTARGGGDHKAS